MIQRSYEWERRPIFMSVAIDVQNLTRQLHTTTEKQSIIMKCKSCQKQGIRYFYFSIRIRNILLYSLCHLGLHLSFLDDFFISKRKQWWGKISCVPESQQHFYQK